MKPLHKLALVLILVVLVLPFGSSAFAAEVRTAEKEIACVAVSKSTGIFDFMKKKDNMNDFYIKNLEKKRRLARAHRRTLLRKKSKAYKNRF